VRTAYNTYTANFGGIRASCSSSASQAAVALARKIYPSGRVAPNPTRSDAGENAGRSEWIVTVEVQWEEGT
jgi:hypothetical protein